MSDSDVKPKVKPKPKPKPRGARSSSGVELNVHSSFYGDFFLLRTPITINGSPAVIETVNGEPVLRVCDISVKLSTILKEVVAPVTRKHGVCSVTNFYYEQVALFLASFNSKESLKKFLTDKEAIEKEFSLAFSKLVKEEAKSSKQPQSSQSPSMEQFQVAVDMKVYLVSLAAVGHPPTVNKINLANHSRKFDTWKRSKLFDFTNAMFTKPPPSIIDISDCASSSVNSDGERSRPSEVIGPNPGTPKHAMKDQCSETLIPITKCTVLRPEDLRKKVKLILHTCNDKENKAVLTSLTPPAIDGNKIADKVVYDGEGFAKIGMFGKKLVAVLFTGQGDMARGNLQTALEKYTNATEIVGVGVGYGNPHKEEISLGDVMVSDVIVKGSMTDEGGEYTFSNTVPVNDKLLQHARNLQNDWNKFQVTSNPDRTSKVHLGSIVSTDTLVKAAASRDKYMETNRKAIGGEMEGWVLLSVLDEMRRKDRIIGIIVIKGVGGYGDKDEDKVWQPTAAMAAVHFLHYILRYSHCGLPATGGVESAELADLELKGVIAWFDLGVQLKIPTDDLLAIREDHKTVEKCRLNMLIKWEQLEKPTWTKLFSALVNIGMKGLADSLAEKYGLPQPFHVAVTPVKGSASSKLMESEQKLTVKTKELKQAKQLQTVTSRKLEKEVSAEVPLLQHKVKSLTNETELLKMQLKHRTEEMEMFEKKKLSAKEDELQLLDSLLKEMTEQISSLQKELTQKETELDATKKQLKEKETELAGMMEELSAKSDQVCVLESEVKKLKQSFDEQQEEMNRKLIEQSAASVSQEKYLREVEIQRDIAEKEASKKKEEIQSYTQELTDKEEQISRLSEKIAEREREMAKLREELDSHHHNSEQPSVEQTRKDDEREQQLLTLMMSAMKLQLELQLTKYKKNEDKMNLEGAKKTVEKYERILESNNQTLGPGDKGQSSSDDSVAVTKHSEMSLLDSSNISLSWRAATSVPCNLIRGVDAAVDGDTVYFKPYYSGRSVYAYNSTNDPSSSSSHVPMSLGTRRASSNIPQPIRRVGSPRSSAAVMSPTTTTTVSGTKILGSPSSNKILQPREEADGCSNPEDSISPSLSSPAGILDEGKSDGVDGKTNNEVGVSSSGHQPVIKTKSVTVGVAKTRGQSLLPTKTQTSASSSLPVSTQRSSQPIATTSDGRRKSAIPRAVTTLSPEHGRVTLGTFVRRSSVPPSSKLLESTSSDTLTSDGAPHTSSAPPPRKNDVISNHETEDRTRQQESLSRTTTDVQSDFQVLTLNDEIPNSNSPPQPDGGRDRSSGRGHIEEWIQQTSETALSPEALADSVPPPSVPPVRDMTSPTFTESSFTYSHNSDVTSQELVDSLKHKVDSLENRLEKETESNVELRMKLRKLERQLQEAQSGKYQHHHRNVTVTKTALI